jgi:hypothetical protein
MPKLPSDLTTSFALRYRVNQILAERGAEVRIVSARAPAERKILGNHFLVDRMDRHLIVQDHVDLQQFAREIGVLSLEENISDWPHK